MARTSLPGPKCMVGKELSREKLVTTEPALTRLKLRLQVHYSPCSSTLGSRFVELTVVGPGGKI